VVHATGDRTCCLFLLLFASYWVAIVQESGGDLAQRPLLATAAAPLASLQLLVHSCAHQADFPLCVRDCRCQVPPPPIFSAMTVLERTWMSIIMLPSCVLRPIQLPQQSKNSDDTGDSSTQTAEQPLAWIPSPEHWNPEHPVASSDSLMS